MQAVSYPAVRVVPTLVDVPEPECPAGGVVVEVGATGVCRSDWHAWQGHDAVPLPHIPGHEFAGTVASVGSGVTRWRIGDRVTVPFACGCGACDFCAVGDTQVCPHQTQPGFTGPGSFAERVAVHAADVNLVGLPDTIDFVTAAALGCRFATAYRALTVHGRLSPGQWLVVYGCGGVGLSAVQIGVALGARVVAVDVSAPAVDRAAALGAVPVVDAGQDVPAAVRDITAGGAHVSVDAIGAPTAAVNSVRGLRRRGRHVQIGLLFGPAATPPLPMDLVIAWELQIHGSHGMAAHEYPPLLAMVTEGAVRPAELIGATITLAEAGEALAALGRNQTSGMTVVDLHAE